MEGSAAWTAVSAIIVALIGAVGVWIAKANEKRAKDSEIATSTAALLAREREARPWAQLDGANDRLEEENERLAAADERLRAERDALTEKLAAVRIECTDWQIKARMADALKDQCEQERLQHAEEVRGLREQIAKLRKRGNE